MEKAELFEHNETAYNKLCELLKKVRTATIDHATGTGKAFIAAKYAYKNSEKKILFITPTYPIINQTKKVFSKIGVSEEEVNVDYMIYRNLLTSDIEKLYKKYDAFILDEYHRAGAKETYKKIKELKRIVLEGVTDKKLIGLTATPKRYLDNERNMTMEIFDGNVASRLTLAEALVRELLPIPTYITSKRACAPYYDKVLRKVNLLGPSKLKNDSMKKMDLINSEIGDEEKGIAKTFEKYIGGKENAKYVVFCNDTGDLERYNRLADNWFARFGSVKKYKVHAYQKKEKNQEELNNFNDSKEGINLLFCVNILNEGVHVDDIDGVIMLRKTKSPIIYFQQIGRALSFSGRNRDIIIFDFVNNFGNHNAIDEVYEEFEEEIRERISKYPQNEEKYKKILDKFKIMDETRKIISKLKEIEEKITVEKIAGTKLDEAIKELEQALLTEDIFGRESTRNAYLTISRYYKFVTNNQFRRLNKLNILLPEGLNISEEERLKLLDGYDSIYEREQKEVDAGIKQYMDYVSSNKKTPSLNSEDENEVELAKRYLNILPRLNDTQKEVVINVANKYSIKLNSFEKVIYKQNIEEEDIEKIISRANKYVENNKCLPEFLKCAVDKLYYEHTLKQSKILSVILDKNEAIAKKKSQEREQERYEKIRYIISRLEKDIDISEDDLKEYIKAQEIVSKRDILYIRKKYEHFKREKFAKIINEEENNKTILAFCRNAKNIPVEVIQQEISLKEQILKDNKTLTELVDFVIQSQGQEPNAESENIHEKALANSMKNNKKQEKIVQALSKNNEATARIYSPQKVLHSLINENSKDQNAKIIILKVLKFFYKNGYKPLTTSSNPEEANLALQFKNECVPQIGSARS